jgi:hypothetical protein
MYDFGSLTKLQMLQVRVRVEYDAVRAGQEARPRRGGLEAVVDADEWSIARVEKVAEGGVSTG